MKKLKKQNIPTKDLYLLELKKVVSIDKVSRLSGYSKLIDYTEQLTGIFVLGRKKGSYSYIDEEYEDIFTGTIYKADYDEIKLGNIKVQVIYPIISDKQRITVGEAKSILETHNFFCINKKYQENTKKLMDFYEKFNTLINTNPKEAEEIAKKIITNFNFSTNCLTTSEEKNDNLLNSDMEFNPVLIKKKTK